MFSSKGLMILTYEVNWQSINQKHLQNFANVQKHGNHEESMGLKVEVKWLKPK